MSVWKLEDFLAELDNMAELHKKRPNSVLAQGLWSSVCDIGTTLEGSRSHAANGQS